jgi:hypothetical protein
MTISSSTTLRLPRTARSAFWDDGQETDERPKDWRLPYQPSLVR